MEEIDQEFHDKLLRYTDTTTEEYTDINRRIQLLLYQKRANEFEVTEEEID